MDYFKLAQVLKPQGIKGELKLKAFTDDLARFGSLKHVFLKKGGEYEERIVCSTRTYKDFVYIKIEGCEDRNTAETLRGVFLYIDRENAAPLPEDAYYIADLEGLSVEDETGKTLGVLKEVLQTGGVDIYSVKGDKNFMFPAVKHVVLNVDINAGKILLDSTRLKEVAIYD